MTVSSLNQPEVKKTFYRLRHAQIDPGAPEKQQLYVSSSSPYFLDHVLQYAHHNYVPTVVEYLQAEKVANAFIKSKMRDDSENPSKSSSPAFETLRSSSQRSTSSLSFSRKEKTEKQGQETRNKLLTSEKVDFTMSAKKKKKRKKGKKTGKNREKKKKNNKQKKKKKKKREPNYEKSKSGKANQKSKPKKKKSNKKIKKRKQKQNLEGRN